MMPMNDKDSKKVNSGKDTTPSLPSSILSRRRKMRALAFQLPPNSFAHCGINLLSTG